MGWNSYTIFSRLVIQGIPLSGYSCHNCLDNTDCLFSNYAVHLASNMAFPFFRNRLTNQTLAPQDSWTTNPICDIICTFALDFN